MSTTLAPTLPVTPAQLRPGTCISRNASRALSGWLTYRHGGCLQPRELFLMYMQTELHCKNLLKVGLYDMRRHHSGNMECWYINIPP